MDITEVFPTPVGRSRARGSLPSMSSKSRRSCHGKGRGALLSALPFRASGRSRSADSTGKTLADPTLSSPHRVGAIHPHRCLFGQNLPRHDSVMTILPGNPYSRRELFLAKHLPGSTKPKTECHYAFVSVIEGSMENGQDSHRLPELSVMATTAFLYEGSPTKTFTGEDR